MSAGEDQRPGKTLLLVGTGMVGGSFALAAKASGLFERVIGVDRNPDALREAQALGIVDECSDSLVACDAACIAVPVGAIAAAVAEAAKLCAFVFDVGSVKRPIVDALSPLPPNFVPCHPIAGSEQAGPKAARADLFQGHTVAMTPAAETDANALATVRGYWQALGAEVIVETPAAHDERMALVSHLPHLVAFAFMEVAGAAKSLDGVGGGFRDFTRIAGADADMWADILRENAPQVQHHLDALMEALRGFSAAAHGENGALRARIAAAAAVKRSMDTARPVDAAPPMDTARH